MVQANESGLWGEHAIPGGRTKTWRLGPLSLWIRKEGDELRIASSYSAPEGDCPPEEKWSRWVVGETAVVSIRPVFPERSVVARTSVPFHVGSKLSTTIFVMIPVWIRISVAGGGVLVEIPSEVLSDTWFGKFTEGELCYWISTDVRRSFDASRYRPHLAVCPVRIQNQSGEDLPVEKLRLVVIHLSIFESEGTLWTDEVKVQFQGGGELSRIEVTGKAFRDIGRPTLLQGPRVPVRKRLDLITFETIKALPSLGWIIQ